MKGGWDWLLLIILFFNEVLGIIVNPPLDEDRMLINPYMGFQDTSVLNDQFWDFRTGYFRTFAGCEVDGKLYDCEGLNWHILNSDDGEFYFDDFDLFLKNLKDREKYMHIRVRNKVGPNDQPEVPAHLLGDIQISSGSRPWVKSETMPEIEYYRCEFLEAWEDFIEKLREKYLNEPALYMMDFGTVGAWGEWYTCKFLLERVANDDQNIDENDPPRYHISRDTVDRIYRMWMGGKGVGTCVRNNGDFEDTYYKYEGFPNRYFLAKGGKEFTRNYVKRGVGWRSDVVGLLQNNWMEDSPLVETIQDNWKYVPITGEFAGNNPDNIVFPNTLCYVKAFHMSQLDNTLGGRAPSDPTYFDELWRIMGYRISLLSAEFDNSVKAGDSVSIQLSFKNEGTAVAYRNYPFYLYLKKVKGDDEDPFYCKAITGVEISKILPRDIVSYDADWTNCVFTDLPEYVVSVDFPISSRIVQGTYEMYYGFEEDVFERSIQLANSDADSTGRYYLGTLSITSSSSSETDFTDCAVDRSELPIINGDVVEDVNRHVNYRDVVYADQSSYVRDDGQKHGEENPLELKNSGDGYRREIYLQFTVPEFSRTILSVTLFLHAWYYIETPETISVDLSEGSPEWTESTIDWESSPSRESSIPLGSFETKYDERSYFEIPAAYFDQLSGKKITLRLWLDHTNDKIVKYCHRSKEQFAPILEIWTERPPDAADNDNDDDSAANDNDNDDDGDVGRGKPNKTQQGLAIFFGVFGGIAGMVVLIAVVVGVILCAFVALKRKGLEEEPVEMKE